MRLFIAVALPADIRAALEQLILSLRPRFPGARWVRPEGIHLTLRFLGEVASGDVERLVQKMRLLVPGTQTPFDVPVGGLGTFPLGLRPRVLWVGVGAASPDGGVAVTTLATLRGKVEEAVTAASLPGVSVESRPFTPHLTLARWGDERPPADLRSVLDQLGGATFAMLGTLHVSSVALIRSVTAPEGARYSTLEAFPL